MSELNSNAAMYGGEFHVADKFRQVWFVGLGHRIFHTVIPHFITRVARSVAFGLDMTVRS